MTSAVTSMPARLGPAQDLDRAGGRDVADVQPRADVLGEQHVAGDDRLLGDRRPAGQAERAGQLALVHLRALGEPRLLRRAGRSTPSNALTYSSARRISTRVGDAVPVVGEDPHPGGGVGHRAELGQPLAAPARR